MKNNKSKDRLLWLLRSRMFWIAFTACVVFAPYLVSRILASSQIVNVFHDQGVATSVSPIAESSGQSEIKIVAFNIAHGRGIASGNWAASWAEHRNQIDEIADCLKELNADIVVLNEVDFCCTWSGHQNQAAEIARRAGYPYRVEQRNLDFWFAYGSFQFGNAILSRHEITKTEILDHPAKSIWENWLGGKKRGVVAEISISIDSSFRIAAIHLEHRSEYIRVESGKQLVKLADKATPLVIAGDFNSTPTGFPKSKNASGGFNTIDELNASEQFNIQPKIPSKRYFTFPSVNPEITIDWIITAGDCRVVPGSYTVIDSKLSDHRPVEAVISVSPQPTTKQR